MKERDSISLVVIEHSVYVHDRLGSGSVYQWDKKIQSGISMDGFDQNGNDRKSSNADLGRSLFFLQREILGCFVPNSPDLKNSHLNLVHDKNQRNIQNFNERNEDDTCSIVAMLHKSFKSPRQVWKTCGVSNA